MQFPERLRPARLARRYKRFLADVVTDDGEEITCHCPNTGSMMGCAEPGSRVWLSRASNPARKYAHTWEMVEVNGGTLVGVHTGRTNALVAEAVADGGLVPELAGYDTIRAEVSVPDAPMRADFRLSGHAELADAFVEVKNVTAAVDGEGIALFPDAVSARGTRHLEVLMQVVARGHRGVLVFCAQRSDVREIRPADRIDPRYGETLRRAIAGGVEVLGLGARVTPTQISVDRRLPVVCPDPVAAWSGSEAASNKMYGLS
jgi:sugar fermentation stimulation protein A